MSSTSQPVATFGNVTRRSAADQERVALSQQRQTEPEKYPGGGLWVGGVDPGVPPEKEEREPEVGLFTTVTEEISLHITSPWWNESRTEQIIGSGGHIISAMQAQGYTITRPGYWYHPYLDRSRN